MATFEERELVDYTVKKVQEIMNSENFVIKDLDKMHSKIKVIQYRSRRMIEKIESLENRIRSLERANIFEKSETSSESD